MELKSYNKIFLFYSKSNKSSKVANIIKIINATFQRKTFSYSYQQIQFLFQKCQSTQNPQQKLTKQKAHQIK